MLRRHLLKLGIGAAAVGAAGLGCKEQAKNVSPNVLFIAVDDLNTWVGCLKFLREKIPSAKTPNIDRLAAQGTLFSNAHAAVPWCMPSRNNMMAGLYANQSGLFNTEELRQLLPTVKTLPQHFRNHGYTALACGKLFHDTSPDLASWDRYEQFPRPASQKRQNPPLSGIQSEDNGDTLDWGEIHVEDKELTDALIADWAIHQLDKNFEQPFFMGVGFRFPHLPWYLPKHYLDQYPLDQITLPWVKEDDLDDLPPAGRKMAMSDPFGVEHSFEKSDYKLIQQAGGWKGAVQAYLAAITCVDQQLGRLLDKLDSSRHAANTIVVLWSDNGFHLGEKLHWRKFTLWDEATRVPVILRVPKAPARGIVNGEAVSLVDIYPTLIELCGLPQPAHKLSGESLVKLLYSADAKRSKPVFVTYGKGNDCVVYGQYRFIRYADGSTEFYDHASDPYEWVNLSERPEYLGARNNLEAFLNASISAQPKGAA